MSDYTKTTNFTAKDSLPSGDSNKIIRGSEHDTEYSAIATAIATKAEASDVTTLGSRVTTAEADIDNLQLEGSQVFTASGTFTAPKAGDYLVFVLGGGAGGGGGGGSTTTHSGGGGIGGAGGQLLIQEVSLTDGQAVTVTIGAAANGGAGGTGAAPGSAGTVGNATSFGAVTAAGGQVGRGGADNVSDFTGGQPGTSGGGFGGGAGGAYTSASGNGNNGSNAVVYGAGGGGGSGSFGNGNTGGSGGNGSAGIVVVTW